ncbi:hypothetical protein HK102_006991 [Quaeritorhiza haematococci]|nr:hypothetical protein HK102_006991 [Quaeritorhiza haematococci]
MIKQSILLSLLVASVAASSVSADGQVPAALEKRERRVVPHFRPSEEEFGRNQEFGGYRPQAFRPHPQEFRPQQEEFKPAAEEFRPEYEGFAPEYEAAGPVQEAQYFRPRPEEFQSQPQFHPRPAGFRPHPQGFHAPQEFRPRPEAFYGETEQFRGRPEGFHSQPQEFRPRPESFYAEPEQFRGRPEGLYAQPQEFRPRPESFYAEPEQFHARPQAFHRPEDFRPQQQEFWNEEPIRYAPERPYAYHHESQSLRPSPESFRAQPQSFRPHPQAVRPHGFRPQAENIRHDNAIAIDANGNTIMETPSPMQVCPPQWPSFELPPQLQPETFGSSPAQPGAPRRYRLCITFYGERKKWSIVEDFPNA